MTDEMLNFCLKATIYKYEKVIEAYKNGFPDEADSLHHTCCRFCKHYACHKREYNELFNRDPPCPLIPAGICGMSGEDLWSLAREAPYEKVLPLYEEILRRLKEMLEDVK